MVQYSSTGLWAIIQGHCLHAAPAFQASRYSFCSCNTEFVLRRSIQACTPSGSSCTVVQCFSLTSPQLLPHFPDCEVDDEVVIPKSFAPLLSFGLGAASPTTAPVSFGSLSRSGLTARPYTCLIDQKPLQRPPNPVVGRYLNLDILRYATSLHENRSLKAVSIVMSNAACVWWAQRRFGC